MNLKNRQQVLLVATIALAALFAGDKLLLTPLARAWQARAAQVTELRKQVAQGTQLLVRETALRNRWDHMRTNTLPADTSLAEQEVLKAFDFWSQDSRVSNMSITPQRKRAGDDFVTLECRVDAAGNLATLSKFLYDIEKDPLALKLETVEITARDSEGQQLALSLQISGLVLNPEPQ
jgi:hypothetical protein